MYARKAPHLQVRSGEKIPVVHPQNQCIFYTRPNGKSGLLCIVWFWLLVSCIPCRSLCLHLRTLAGFAQRLYRFQWQIRYCVSQCPRL